MEKGVRKTDDLKKESAETAAKVREFLVGEFPKHGDIPVIVATIEVLERIRTSVEIVETADLDIIKRASGMLKDEWNVRKSDIDFRLLESLNILEPVETAPTYGAMRAFKTTQFFKDESMEKANDVIHDMAKFQETLPKTLASSSLFVAYAHFLLWSHKQVWTKVSPEKRAVVNWLMWNMFEDYRKVEGADR